MGPKPWNVTKVAMIGAAFGVLYVGAQIAAGAVAGPSETLAGQAVGSAIGGAMLFALVAVVRNWAGRSRR